MQVVKGYGRLLSFAILSAVICSAACAAAAEELLFGHAPKQGELSYACFARHYDPAHLASHPEQNVTDMVALAYRYENSAPGDSLFNMTVKFRRTGEHQFPGECMQVPGSNRLRCGVECDGGNFTVTVRDKSSVMVDVSRGIGSCDVESPRSVGFRRDDKVFRLDRTDMAACRDLIWDDDLRPRLLKHAGVDP